MAGRGGLRSGNVKSKEEVEREEKERKSKQVKFQEAKERLESRSKVGGKATDSGVQVKKASAGGGSNKGEKSTIAEDGEMTELTADWEKKYVHERGNEETEGVGDAGAGEEERRRGLDKETERASARIITEEERRRDEERSCSE
ncbi:hypothetical protein TKK_0016649 [Trichogramma kaykai]